MVFLSGEVCGTFVWFCFPTPLIQIGEGAGGRSCLESPGLFQNGIEKIESIIRFPNRDVDIFVNVSNRNSITLQGAAVRTPVSGNPG